MYITKNEIMFLTFLYHGWGEAGFGDSQLWDGFTPEQLDKIKWLFDGRETFAKKLEDAGYTNDSVVDRMELPEDLKKDLR